MKNSTKKLIINVAVFSAAFGLYRYISKKVAAAKTDADTDDSTAPTPFSAEYIAERRQKIKERIEEKKHNFDAKVSDFKKAEEGEEAPVEDNSEPEHVEEPESPFEGAEPEAAKPDKAAE